MLKGIGYSLEAIGTGNSLLLEAPENSLGDMFKLPKKLVRLIPSTLPSIMSRKPRQCLNNYMTQSILLAEKKLINVLRLEDVTQNMPSSFTDNASLREELQSQIDRLRNAANDRDQYGVSVALVATMAAQAQGLGAFPTPPIPPIPPTKPVAQKLLAITAPAQSFTSSQSAGTLALSQGKPLPCLHIMLVFVILRQKFVACILCGM